MAQSKTETEQTIVCSQQANEALKRINAAVTDVSDQLASATEELAVVSGTINENMENIANAVEGTTVKSTELSVSSQQLRQMASEMKKSLSGFKLYANYENQSRTSEKVELISLVVNCVSCIKP
ncbi:hypothetical protein [Rheinheimera sp. NSM]|uniref:hypothetical protein n=1 Tax=Rheinheimera sp. NSM TaxID=3457884 RepID=UPI004036A252